jgi:signal transduction histidine kinase
MKLPGRWRLGRKRGTDETGAEARAQAASAPAPAPDGSEEDARLLRRTRLRLMALSGLVTLAILVALGVAVYVTVSNVVVSADVRQLENAAFNRPDPDAPYGLAVEGRSAGLIAILIAPNGTVVSPPANLLSPGLPNQASLAAVRRPGDVDMRDVTMTDGSPCRVISGFSDDPRFVGYKIQWAQPTAGEGNLLNALRNTLLIGGGLALLAALLAGYLYAGRALVPIRAAAARRQEALRRQREFTANASHELRTPLTVIRASVEDLQRNRRRRVDEVGEALTDIDAEARHLTALVDDMLLLARTDSDVVVVDRVPLDMADVAVEAASALGSLGEEWGVTVVADPLPSPVLGDPVRLRQLVTILLDNAIRHSPRGSTVSLRVRPDGEGTLMQVEDQGPGIKPENLVRIFERFWRADDAPAGGTGLGLAIARWIVEQHGGSIGAGNRAEGGALLWVRLPAVGTAARSASDAPVPQAPSGA